MSGVLTREIWEKFIEQSRNVKYSCPPLIISPVAMKNLIAYQEWDDRVRSLPEPYRSHEKLKAKIKHRLSLTKKVISLP